MKANKKTLMAVKSYLEGREGWDLDEVIYEVVHNTKLLNSKEAGINNLDYDECNITWDKENICSLYDFVQTYSEQFIQNICNILDSFVGDDISCYFDEEE